MLRGASGAPKGASGTSRGGSWELQGRPLKRLGCFGGASGRLWGALASSEDASEAKVLKILNSSYFPGFSLVFEVLGSLKSTEKLPKRQQKRLGGLFLRLGGLLLSMLEAKASLG